MDFAKLLETYKACLEACMASEFNKDSTSDQDPEWAEMVSEEHKREEEAKAAILAHVAALEADLAKAREALTWRPIESVPKDGTKILLGYFPEGGYSGDNMAVAFWHETKKMWADVHNLYRADGYFSPTHWLPLPKAALDNSREGGGAE